MEKAEVLVLVTEALESQKKDLLAEIELTIEDKLNAVKSKAGLSAADVQQLINDAINTAKLGGSSKPAVKGDPDFDPKGKYEVLDKVKVMPTKGNTYHKQGEAYVIEGHQATMQIRKGFCTFIEVVEKYVPKKTTGKLLSKVETN